MYRKSQIDIEVYRDLIVMYRKKTIWPHVSNTWARRDVDTRLQNRRKSMKYMHETRAKKWRRGTTQYMPKRGQYTMIHESGGSQALNQGGIEPSSPH